MKLHDKQFYDENFNKDRYCYVQILRHRAKFHKKRSVQHYIDCVNETRDLIRKSSCMICMGTRNNHERDVFRRLLDGVYVYSLDISPLSDADYVMDFNDLPAEWKDKWDILFSNALDHAVDATSVFYKWVDVVKVGGIIVVGFDKNNIKKEEKRLDVSDVVSSSDCCSFAPETVDEFMKSDNDRFEFIKYFENSYRYYVLRKR